MCRRQVEIAPTDIGQRHRQFRHIEPGQLIGRNGHFDSHIRASVNRTGYKVRKYRQCLKVFAHLSSGGRILCGQPVQIAAHRIDHQRHPLELIRYDAAHLRHLAPHAFPRGVFLKQAVHLYGKLLDTRACLNKILRKIVLRQFPSAPQHRERVIKNVACVSIAKLPASRVSAAFAADTVGGAVIDGRRIAVYHTGQAFVDLARCLGHITQRPRYMVDAVRKHRLIRIALYSGALSLAHAFQTAQRALRNQN